MLLMNEKRLESVERRHIRQVLERLRPEARRNLGGMADEQVEALILHYQQCGTAFAFVVNDYAIAIGGVFMLWSGVGEAWLYATPEVERQKKFIADSVRLALDESWLVLGLHRVQMACRASDLRACRFAEWLGLRTEGVLSRYGVDGSDFMRYART